MNDTTWMAQGACVGVNPDLFFPERGASTKEAKAVCARCPVQYRCLAWAVEQRELFGIWGGTSVRDRRRLRALRRVA